MEFSKDIKEILNIDLSSDQENQFKIYYDYLIEYNKITNLTRIVEKNEVYYKHFFDSLTLTNSVDLSIIESVCDMGSGAGFPSIPLKIVFPHLKITIIDSLNKRIIFLKNLVEKLNLKNVELIHDRIENYSKKNQNKFDLTTARALGNMSLITEMAIPMTKVEGYFIAMKASNYESELDQSKDIIKKIGSVIKCINNFDLPNNYGTRTHIVLKKEKYVGGYPRSYAQMTNNPL
jgi:16S rRNA (guanine527-N7)-methyltransferase